MGLTPKARILATALSGADPTIMLTGPAPASRKALEKAGMTVDELDLVEINEAFAAVVLRFVRDMGLDMEKVNVNGGAIAMGHPLGATGGMILGTLIDELHRTGGRYGLATLCVGGRHGHRDRRGGDLIMAESTTIRWEQGRGRHRRADARRPEPVGEHDERRLRGVDGRDGRSTRGREGPDHRRRHHLREEDVLRRAATSTTSRRATKDDAPELAEMVRAGKAQLRRLETLGKPVVRGDQRRRARRRPGDRAGLPSPHRRR